MRGLHCEQRVQDFMMAGMEGGELSAASAALPAGACGVREVS